MHTNEVTSTELTVGFQGDLMGSISVPECMSTNT